MSAPNAPPDLPPPPPPSGQWAYPTNEKGEPKKSYVMWIVLGGAGCFVAVVVLGLLATVLVPNLIRSLSRARQTKAQADIEMLCAALEEYKDSHAGQYPEALEALLQHDSHGHSGLAELPRDPWDRAYRYERPTAERAWPDVYSLGADGLPGGSGEAEDVHPLRSQPGKR